MNLIRIQSTFTAKIHINSVKIKTFMKFLFFLRETCLNFPFDYRVGSNFTFVRFSRLSNLLLAFSTYNWLAAEANFRLLCRGTQLSTEN